MYGRAARTPGAGVRPAPCHERPARSASARRRPRAPDGFPRGWVAFRAGFGSVVGPGETPDRRRRGAFPAGQTAATGGPSAGPCSN
ncbi:hypothetical protein SGPA1_50272 [Streptomyces misionensis JCM 4497]